MANNKTILSNAQPACYCCLSADNLEAHNNGRGLTYWLCADCQDAHWQRVDGIALLVCPCHGEQRHKDVNEDSVKYYLRQAKKKGYWYECPVKTRYAQENDKAPVCLLDYKEI